MNRVLIYLPVFLMTLQLGVSSDFTGIPTEPKTGDKLLGEYFEKETRRVAARTEKIVESDEDWTRQSPALRRQLFEMLGLQPLPVRSPLKPVITGTFTHDGVVIEKLQFQSRPGLYVTGNFYRAENAEGALPTIIYVCGHGREKDGDISLGNKAYYHHHPLWFARNGYNCLIIDTLQLGEIEGIHHGTHRYDRWWWNSRGYTPAGVEAWNGIRAIDYLETRPEVDKTRIGLTGRSGGGAYSYWIAALDERIKAVAPVAGITSMKNHIVDGCIEGHCDCMFMVNTYRWDFPLLASLVAPRPMLIINTDNDRIFPTEGVVDVFTKTAKVYDRIGAKNSLGLAFYQGPHLDTQPLRVSAFHWFERHLKGKPIGFEMPDTAAPKEIEPVKLRVLEEIPANERNTAIDEYFTKRIPRRAAMPQTEVDWRAHQALTRSRLKSKSFRGWPSSAEGLDLSEEFRSEKDGMTFSRFSFNSQSPYRLPLYLVHREGLTPAELDLIVLNVADEDNWPDFLSSVGAAFPDAFPGIDLPELDQAGYESEKKMHQNMKWGMAYLAPRGIGPTSWTDDKKESTHIRRRFSLLGQTLDGMRVWDIRRGIQTLRSIEGADKPQLWIQASRTMAGNALYAAFFEKDIHRLDLHELPVTHREGPEFLNVLRFVDIPEMTTFVGHDAKLRLYTDNPEQWKYPQELAAKFKWPEKQIEVRALPADEE